MTTYDQWKTFYPSRWDEQDAMEGYIEIHTETAKDEILDNPEAMVDVLMSATAEQLMPLATRLCLMLINNVPNWDIQHAGNIREAMTILVDNAAEEIAETEYEIEERQ